ncbi:NhaA family Na+:H+ antiporter [Sinorhizobium fredii]|uniref:Na(+)/H(+) antiporter NhaA n=1 Tax=Sinorhizobium fredii (strain USDA 257) TaxID=1185652 RepID=I3X943_SINF2|nr:Na+/H+ antiporter NhaA [Sinorhizobium fredii]AFL52399.1 Na(+)/H(+) antiporter NhaA [Sinorhizobium fredii USDA 257]
MSVNGRITGPLRRFFNMEFSAGLLLMVAALLAITLANSRFSASYFAGLRTSVGPFSVQQWINDGLMALFFLQIGLEIKREWVHGELSSWRGCILPGAAAAGGMLVPAVLYALFNRHDAEALRGWAIPSATDVAFALGVLSLLGRRVPSSLKIFLAALAIIDDVGAIVVIALFFGSSLSIPDLAVAALLFMFLAVMNRWRMSNLALYALLGLALWAFLLRSGVHATLAGVLVSLTIPAELPLNASKALPSVSPLHRLEHYLRTPVAFLIVPIFGFANAGVSLAGVTPAALIEPITLGVAAGLSVGKLVGVFGTVLLLVYSKSADLPEGATWLQVAGISLLCGFGFTMSLFIAQLAFNDPELQDQAKLGILAGSLIAGAGGYAILRVFSTGPF